MSLHDTLLADFDHEMAVTRKVLERLPDAAFAWKPHERSFGLGGLASHIAQIPHWGEAILDRESYDLATRGPRAPEQTTTAGVLAVFDAHVAAVRHRLLERTDAQLLATWTLRRNGQAVMSMPRLAALRNFMLHHLIHHRWQLTVYLRIQNVPLPPLYGPTADEPM